MTRKAKTKTEKTKTTKGKAPAPKATRRGKASRAGQTAEDATVATAAEEALVAHEPATTAPAPVTAADPTPEATTAEGVTEPAQSADPAPTVPVDVRLPVPGTVLRKLDRKNVVRCECTVEDGGKVSYRGTAYMSLSAAAVAAANDLGLVCKSINGWAWWGLKKPARAQDSGRDPVRILDRAWEAFRGRLNGLLGDNATDETRARVVDAVKKHAASLERIGERVG